MLLRRCKDKCSSLWKSLGPGLITGASDDDPSGIATYSQTGAQFGFQLLWLSIFTFPLMATIQEMCARLGIVTRKGLAANIREYFPSWVLWLCVVSLVIANTINIAADIAAMVAAIQLLISLPTAATAILLTLVTLCLQIFLSYRKYSRYLKWLSVTLLLYIATALVVHFPIKEVLLNTFIPSMAVSKEALILICAILGTTISPYLFFWQSSQEIEELKEHHETTGKRYRHFIRHGLQGMKFDVWFGMLLSNLIMFFIIAVTAATLHTQGITTIRTAADAARALEPLAGRYASLFFSVGIISTGLLALPVLSGASAYAIADSFGWRQGLNLKFRRSPKFYMVIVASMIAGLVIAACGFDPIKLLIVTAVINGIVSAPLILAVVILSSHTKVMGTHANGMVKKYVGIAISVLMALAGGLTIWFSFFT